MDAILVNRFYLRGVEQIDRRTGDQGPDAAGRAARRHELAGPLALGANGRAVATTAAVVRLGPVPSRG